jgi:L-amino acid N-acyltransferase YncA
MSDAIIRLAAAADLPAINDIYNHYVLHSTCTYQLEPETLEARTAWFEQHSPDEHPVTVAILNGAIVGWGALSQFRPRAAYGHTVEASVYLRHDAHRRGSGKALLLDLIARAKAAGHHTLMGGASADQVASLALQKSLGFVQVGYLKEVGFKFGRWLDVVYSQIML